MTRLDSTALAIQIAEHRAKTRDETRIRLAQLEQANEDLKERLQYYRARCPVLASDVGPEHTAARVLAFALANGWSEPVYGGPHGQLSSQPRRKLLEHPNVQDYILTIPKASYPPGEAYRLPPVLQYCNAHAQASGMAPLDVLAAIGAMP